MGLGNKLKQEVMGLSQKALERLFADEQRAGQIAAAIGAVQRGKQTLDATQRAVMNQLNFATRADFKNLGKQVSGLRRRVKDLLTKLDRLA